MLLTGYTLEIFKSKCNPGATGVHCFAHLDSDISAVLPYLNSSLGGFRYTDEPPSLTLKNYGKLITLHPRKIAINALHDRDEAETIVAWLQREINETWEKRSEIVPNTQSFVQPVLLEVLKLLPKTNCQLCGVGTCMVFASRVVDGVFDQNSCPSLDGQGRKSLKDYLACFFTETG